MLGTSSATMSTSSSAAPGLSSAVSFAQAGEGGIRQTEISFGERRRAIGGDFHIVIAEDIERIENKPSAFA